MIPMMMVMVMVMMMRMMMSLILLESEFSLEDWLFALLYNSLEIAIPVHSQLGWVCMGLRSD
jgi:hypothetical protein